MTFNLCTALNFSYHLSQSPNRQQSNRDFRFSSRATRSIEHNSLLSWHEWFLLTMNRWLHTSFHGYSLSLWNIRFFSLVVFRLLRWKRPLWSGRPRNPRCTTALGKKTGLGSCFDGTLQFGVIGSRGLLFRSIQNIIEKWKLVIDFPLLPKIC